MVFRNRWEFTAIELVGAALILLVLVAFSMAGYQRYRDRAAMLVDETNQKILQAAVKLYAYDTNALPGSLSDLRGSDLRRAYAQVTGGKRPYTFAAFLAEQVGLFDVAEAAPLPDRYYNKDISILTCPGDPTPPAEGGVSYALASGWENRPLSALLDSRNENDVLIIEADEKFFIKHQSSVNCTAVDHGFYCCFSPCSIGVCHRSHFSGI